MTAKYVSDAKQIAVQSELGMIILEQVMGDNDLTD